MTEMKNTNGCYTPSQQSVICQIADNDLREILPDISAETLRHDLVDLVKHRLSRWHGRGRGMTYSAAWGYGVAVLTREN